MVNPARRDGVELIGGPHGHDRPAADGGRRAARGGSGQNAGRKAVRAGTHESHATCQGTCRIAGYADGAQVDANLSEWNYGDYEGKSTPQIRDVRPGWELWKDGVPNGETVEQVYARAAKVIDRAMQATGDVALFAHGHILRILAACWLALPPNAGRLFALSTATVSILGYEREQRVISRWNLPPSGGPATV